MAWPCPALHQDGQVTEHRRQQRMLEEPGRGQSARPSSPDTFFLWAPYHMGQYQCPDCTHKLTGCGLYKTILKVLDTTG
ncbi:uncharacterized protein AKAME5_002021900 [Lates japonicus]|uniref:DUF6729 domain-containing protein n=1 Tax=Lates japonicus TaxID=270547 RepID=A0AAD3N9U8_LATJO|nr:uncharacterized protein AKAME5_002021900 [Lates japonicus]